MKEYRSALDGLRWKLDERGLSMWVEKMGRNGKPDIFYRYDSSGRLMKHTRKLFGFVLEPAEYMRFGELVEIKVVKRKPSYEELR